MREIIMVHLGQTGIQIANEFWKLICEEHDIKTTGQVKTGVKIRGNWDVLLNKSQTNRYYPSAILIDSNPMAVEHLEIRSFFNPKFVFYEKETTVTFLQGYDYGEKHEDDIMKIFDAAVSQTTSLQGFILVHSIAGGTGSGLGGWLVEKLKKRFPECGLTTVSVLPFYEVTSSITSYNSILCIEKLVAHPDFVVIIENSTVLRMAEKFRSTGTFENINKLISQVCSGITASLRFKGGKFNFDMREFKLNLVPYQKLKFLISAITPLREDLPERIFTLDKLMEDVYDDDHMFVDTTRGDNDLGKEKGSFFSSVILIRGSLGDLLVKKKLEEIKHQFSFLPYISTGIRYGLSPVKASRGNHKFEALALHNHTSIRWVFHRFLEQFDLLFNRGAYINWFVNSRMEIKDLQNAREIISGLISEYLDAEQ